MTETQTPPPPRNSPTAPAKRSGKKVVIDDRPLWKKKRLFLPVGIIGLLVVASLAAGGADDTTTKPDDVGVVSTTPATNEVSVAPTPVPTLTPVPLGRTAISFDEIVSRSDEQTDAQWEKFADELEADYRAEEWVGYVLDVREQLLGDAYYVELATDPGGFLADFNKDLSEEEALALKKGDRLVVSGDIKAAYRIGTVSIELAE